MKTKTTRITFSRHNGYCLENLVVIEFLHNASLKSPQKVLEAFEQAITLWVETSPKGQEAWKNSCEDLNIGDLLNETWDKSLEDLLKKEGIASWRCLYELVEGEEVSYDHVLADSKQALLES